MRHEPLCKKSKLLPIMNCLGDKDLKFKNQGGCLVWSYRCCDETKATGGGKVFYTHSSVEQLLIKGNEGRNSDRAGT